MIIFTATGAAEAFFAKGDSVVERVVHFTFGIHAPADTVSSWLTAIGACGIVRAVEGSERSYLVTVRRDGAMEYLETLLSEGRRRGVLAWRAPAP
jgi:hypothetical protein